MGFLLIMGLLVIVGVTVYARRRNRLLDVDDVPLAHPHHLNSERAKYSEGGFL